MSAPNNGIWLGLLKWSLAYSDGTTDSNATRMTDENKMFLEKVMKECVKDEPARLNEIIREFMKLLSMDISDTPSIPNSNPYQITQEIISNAVAAESDIDNYLYELEDIVDQIDMAQIFVKFGGLECLVRFLEIAELGALLRGHIAAVIGELSQNNLKVQDDIFNKNNFLRRIIDVYLTPYTDSCEILYDTEQLNKLRTKTLYAISCSIRSHPAAEVFFAINYTSAVFQIAFKSAHVALIQKALYFSSALISSEHVSTSSSNCITNVIQAMIPASFSYLEFDESELRESVCICLRSILQSRIGWAYLNEASRVADKATLGNLLAVRIDSAKKSLGALVQTLGGGTGSSESDDLDKSRLTHELGILLDLNHLLLSPVFPDSSSNSSTAMNSLMVV